MRNILLNAFSIQMIAEFNSNHILFNKVQGKPDLKNFDSYIGHQDLANILGVECNRSSVQLNDSDTIVVAQYVGSRLPEGSTELPPDAKIEFWRVIILYQQD